MSYDALEGITVISLEQYIAGPGATQILADFGAEVIKIESPAGDSSRSSGTYGEAILRQYNRGKRSVVLDLKSPAGLADIERLIADADVFVHNLRPGVLESLGLGIERLREKYPQLICAGVSGFGLDGPGRRSPGLDIAAQARSGLMSVTGAEGEEPQRVEFPVVDMTAASLLCQAVLAALVRRGRDGRGMTIDVSLLDAAVWLQGTNWSHYFLTGVEPTRVGNGQTNAVPASELVPTSDGHVVLSAYRDPDFAELCRAMQQPELAQQPEFATLSARVGHRMELRQVLRAHFADMTTEQTLELLTKHSIVCGRVNTYSDVLEDPDVLANQIFVAHQDARAQLPLQMASPWVIDGIRGALDGAIPALGEHNREVLSTERAVEQ